MAIVRKRKVSKVTIVEDTKTVTKTAVELTDSEQEILESFLKARTEEPKPRRRRNASPPW